MNRLRKIRKSQGYSQEGFAAKVGFAASRISDYEREIITPSLFNSMRIAQALGVTVESIWELDDE